MRAMRALVAELQKRKYAILDSSPARLARLELERTNGRETGEAASPDASGTRRERTDALDQDVHRTDTLAIDQPHTRQRGRHIPAAVRRSVFERDGNRCSYVDANGARCQETHRLEFHHLKPFARGGAHCVSNLTLRCAAHNALAAEQDFGPELIEHKKTSRQPLGFQRDDVL